MKNELQIHEEGPEEEMRLYSLRAILEKKRNLHVLMAYIDSGFKKNTSIHNRLAIKMNRCLQETYIPEWMTKGKTTLIHKHSKNKPTQTTILT